MKRKLVKQGAATLMVSLPSKWVKEHHLNKGSEIDIEELDSGLLVSTEPVDVKSETEIKLVGMTESSVRTMITNTYRRGYDKIKVFFDSEEQFNILTNVVKTKLIGFDIIKKEKNFCIVENITEPSADQFDNILKKMFFNISILFDISEKICSKSKEKVENFEEVEERIQKYDNFCRRIISKKRYSAEKPELLWNFLALVLHAQREIYHMNRILAGNVAVSDSTKYLLKEAKEMFNLIQGAYFEKKIALLAEVHEKEKDIIYKKGYALLEAKKGKEALVIYHIVSAIRQFYQSNSPLAGIIL